MTGASNDRDQARMQMMYDANRKSAGVAYLLWIFVGGFGAHRFYLGRTGSAIAQLMLLLLGWLPLFMGWIALGVWLIVDLFLVAQIVAEENMKIVNQLTR